LECSVRLTGIIFEVAPTVPAIPVERSCWKEPTTSNGTASLNEFCRLGNSEITYPADIGTSVGPAIRFGCPNAYTLSPSTYVAVPFALQLISPRINSTLIEDPGSILLGVDPARVCALPSPPP